jgi:hypothetical protein
VGAASASIAIVLPACSIANAYFVDAPGDETGEQTLIRHRGGCRALRLAGLRYDVTDLVCWSSPSPPSVEPG